MTQLSETSVKCWVRSEGPGFESQLWSASSTQSKAQDAEFEHSSAQQCLISTFACCKEGDNVLILNHHQLAKLLQKPWQHFSMIAGDNNEIKNWRRKTSQVRAWLIDFRDYHNVCLDLTCCINWKQECLVLEPALDIFLLKMESIEAVVKFLLGFVVLLAFTLQSGKK